jgi:hypothetical protein
VINEEIAGAVLSCENITEDLGYISETKLIKCYCTNTVLKGKLAPYMLSKIQNC